MPFETFPIPAGDAGLDMAQQRLDAQNALVDAIQQPLSTALMQGLSTQGALRQRIEGRLTRQARGQVKKTTEMVGQIGTALMMAAGQAVAQQTDLANQIGSAVLAAGAPLPVSEPTRTGGPGLDDPIWYALCPGSATVASITTALGLPPGVTPLGGPMTSAAATALSLASWGSAACPPPTTTPPAPAPSSPLWYCVMDPVGDVQVMQLTAAQVVAGGVGGWQISGGPYPDLATATSTCSGDTSPAPTGSYYYYYPTEPSPPGPTPVVSCSTDPCAPPTASLPDDQPQTCAATDPNTVVIALPGSKDWCDNLATVTQALAAIGQQIRSVLFGWSTIGAASGTSVSTTWSLVFGGAASTGLAVGSAILAALDAFAVDVRAYLAKMLCPWEQLAALTPSVGTDTMIALVSLRTVVKLLGSLRVGMTFPVTLTVDLSIILPQMERVLDYIVESVSPSIIPGSGEAISAWLNSDMKDSLRDCWLSAHGVSADVWRPLITASAQRLQSAQLIEYARRNDLSIIETDDLLKYRGWRRDEDRQWTQELYDRLPPAEIQIRWAFRGATDDAFVGAWQLEEGFGTWWAGTPGHDAYATGTKQDYARLQWRASWTLPDAATMREWVWRLRPSAVGDVGSFQWTDMADALRATGHPERSVQALGQALYRPLGAGEITTLYTYHLANDGDYADALLSLGTDPRYTPALGQAARWQRNKTRAMEARGLTPANVGELVRTGILPVADAQSALQAQGYTPAEVAGLLITTGLEYASGIVSRAQQQARMRTTRAVQQAYRVGTLARGPAMSALTSTGMDDQSAGAILSAVDIDAQQRIGQTVVSGLRSGFMRGEMTGEQALSYLMTAGITQQRAGEYVQEWSVQLSSARKVAATGQIVKWASTGLLPVGVARQRLHNLGWGDPDLALQVAQINQSLAAAQAKAQRAEAASQAKAVAALKQAERQAEQARRQAQAALKAQEPIGTIHRWYELGVYTRAEAVRRLNEEGYAPSTIARYLEEWDQTAATSAAKLAEIEARQQSPEAHVRAWLKDGIIDEVTARTILAAEGLEPVSIGRLIEEWSYVKPSIKTGPAPTTNGPPAGSR